MKQDSTLQPKTGQPSFPPSSAQRRANSGTGRQYRAVAHLNPALEFNSTSPCISLTLPLFCEEPSFCNSMPWCTRLRRTCALTQPAWHHCARSRYALFSFTATHQTFSRLRIFAHVLPFTCNALSSTGYLYKFSASFRAKPKCQFFIALLPAST